MSKQKSNRDLREDQLIWQRDATDWVLHLGRRRVGRVVPDESFPRMWRPVLSGGRLGDVGNLSWAKSTVLDAAAREIEHAQKCANGHAFTEQNEGEKLPSTSQIAQTDEPVPMAPGEEPRPLGLWKGSPK